MRIGFDLDKVFIDSPPFIPSHWIEKAYKKKDNGILLYRIPSYPEQLFRKSLHYPAFRPPIKQNIAILKELAKQKHELYLISSRYKFLEKITNDLIKRHHLDKFFTNLYFNYENQQPHLFKNEVLNTLNLDMYIDDDLSLLKHIAKNNKKTKFYWLNRGRTQRNVPQNIVGINSLTEIMK
jgi:uncharacterized HAD superfamily protein